jgi:DNA-binding transcriptional LysR family regulator
MEYRSTLVQVRCASFVRLAVLLLALLPWRAVADDYHSNVPATDDDTDRRDGPIVWVYVQPDRTSWMPLWRHWLRTHLRSSLPVLDPVDRARERRGGRS